MTHGPGREMKSVSFKDFPLDDSEFEQSAVVEQLNERGVDISNKQSDPGFEGVQLILEVTA